MPHYHFDLSDGFTRKDRRGLDCANDTEAIIAGRTIGREVAVASSDRSHALHISVMDEAGREVSQIPILWPSGLGEK